MNKVRILMGRAVTSPTLGPCGVSTAQDCPSLLYLRHTDPLTHRYQRELVEQATQRKLEYETRSNRLAHDLAKLESNASAMVCWT